MARDDHELPMAGDADPTDDSLDPNELRTLEITQRPLSAAAAKDASQGQPPIQLTQQLDRQTLRDAGPATHDTAPGTVTTIELQQLGQYKLLAKLGQGGMGAVYQALHTKLDKLVALKVLPAERMQDAAAVARFEREMRAVGKLKHENIVAAHDAGEINGTHYLVMELVQGVDLGTIARDQAPLPIAESCEIIRQAARGLQHAHENNLVHRDIKPSNLMLAEESNGPVVKILDMGLALLDEQHAEHPELTASGQIMGTLDYMPPEQAGDTHTVDIRADIYSLGATLYKLLSGCVPFQGPQYTNTVKKLVALATQDPPRIDSLRADLPEELVTIVHRMMARQPEDRYATPQQVADAVAPFAAGANLAALLAVAAQATEATTQVKRLPSAAKADASVSVRSSVVDTQSQLTRGSANQSDLLPIAPPRPPRRFNRGVLLAGAGLPILALLGVILLSLRTPHGEIVVELADGIPAEAAKNLKIEVSGNGQVKLADATAGWTIDVAEGKYQARLAGGADEFQLEQNQVTVTRGKQALLKVSLRPLPKQPAVEQHAGTAPMSEPAPQPMPQPMPPDTAPARTKTWQATPEQQAFFDHVAKLPVDEQAAAVAAKLKEINPGYDGAFKHRVEDGQVTAFMFGSTHIVDLWPVRALPAVQELHCGGREEESKLSDLSPLQGLPLRTLWCGKSGVADLSPLRGMPLKQIHVNSTRVQDISPLAGMPLELINGDETSIKDLTPLKGMPLQYLFCGRTAVEDLSPLQGLPLKMFRCDTTPVTDISPLRGMKLNELDISRTIISDLSVLADMPLYKLLYDVRLFDSDDFDLIGTLPLRTRLQIA